MKEHKFTIKGQLDGLNEIIAQARGNIYSSANKKKKQTKLVALAVMSHKIKKIDKQIDIEINWYCKNKRRDKDNIMAGQKYILDGLQVAKVIENDGWKEIGNIDHNFYIDKVDPRIEVILKEQSC